MSGSGLISERAVILAPRGRDAEIASWILNEIQIASRVCDGLPSLCGEIARGAGLAVIADEATQDADLRPLVDALAAQPAWSDFPIILLTQRGGEPERNPKAARLAEVLGNVTFLERPFHPTTLASLATTAVRGRRRQYEARSRLEQLSESERRLQTALKGGRLGSWTLDVATMTLDASETCRAHFGRPPNQPFDYPELIASIHPDDVDRMRAAVTLTLETGADYVIEYRNLWPDCSVHWIEVRARALEDDTGAVAQLIGVTSNITVRKTSELERERLLNDLAAERAALSELTATLEERVYDRTAELMTEIAARERAQDQLLQSQKMEGLGQLTGGVAHDFNNLLMAVMGNLDLLRKRMPDDPRLHRLVDGAMQGAQRGAALTKRMLAFARQQDLKTGSADLSLLLGDMRDLLDRTLGPQVTLNLHMPQGLPPAQVDANQVELAILNLAINARDAMPNGGVIDVRIDRARPSSTVTALKATDYLRVIVSDNGTGMEADTLKRAIEPFFSTKPVGKGTGLGLSMVHGLAVQLGGALELTSTVGHGTCATLWLPIAARPVDVAAAPAAAAVSERRATILVVDDDPLIAGSTVDMLEDLGHTVIEANSAKHALEILERGQVIDLMMTDQAMPGMTGTELAKTVHRTRPDLPVLLATGYAELPSGEEIDLPRLSKPYGQAQLQEQINRLLAR